MGGKEKVTDGGRAWKRSHPSPSPTAGQCGAQPAQGHGVDATETLCVEKWPMAPSLLRGRGEGEDEASVSSFPPNTGTGVVPAGSGSIHPVWEPLGPSHLGHQSGVKPVGKAVLRGEAITPAWPGSGPFLVGGSLWGGGPLDCTRLLSSPLGAESGCSP